ncbi:MAG: glycosyltransferase family 2 protein [Ruminococcus sp.]|jgi:glycosyltransferase involved in cell wall biosynthesis|nr:glycosyltransferase family 2 protein [Ruminococcus sp.]
MEKVVLKKTVIIPFYSNSIWLDEALESVINQTEHVDEIIVINDGSKENIDKIKNKYRDKAIFLYEENKGAGAARNLGIKNATGDVIFFLDSDDIWCLTKVKKQIEKMNHDRVVWCATAYSEFGNSNIKKKNPVIPYISKGLAWEHMYNSTMIATPTVAVMRKVLDDEPFAEDMKNGQDTFLWFRLANQYRLGVIEEPLTQVRMRDGSTRLKIDSHIRIRAKLWKKMTVTKELLEPTRNLTRIGYKICYQIYEKDPKVRKNIKNLFLFGFAWLIFRIDNILLDRK